MSRAEVFDARRQRRRTRAAARGGRAIRPCCRGVRTLFNGHGPRTSSRAARAVRFSYRVVLNPYVPSPLAGEGQGGGRQASRLPLVPPTLALPRKGGGKQINAIPYQSGVTTSPPARVPSARHTEMPMS